MSPEVTYVLQSLGTVAVFGGALWVAAWGIRRLGVQTSRGPLEILARQPLDGRRAIYLVRVGKKVLVVGATDGSLTRLASTTMAAISSEKAIERDAADETQTPKNPPTRFRDVLARVVRPR